MAQKFRFNVNRLEFEKVTRPVGYFLLKGLKYLLVTVSLAVCYYAVFALVIDTDTEKRIKAENEAYSSMYEGMLERERLIENVIEGMRGKDDVIYRQLFNAPVPDFGVVGVDAFLSGEEIPEKDFIRHINNRIDQLVGSADKVEDNFRRVMEIVSSGNPLPPLTSPIDSFPASRAGASVGSRINPFYKIKAEHDGLDMLSPQGTAVNAPAEGIVTGTVRSGKGKGNVVEITHPGGYVTRYAHLEDIKVSRGQKVSRGTMIGHVGMSGNSFVPHLHYEVYRDSIRLDPVNHFFLSLGPDEYMNMLFMSANAGQSMD
ncbi:MAG: M23 family metallopeptidase [Candidatus Cryptobacteroides sp.]